MTRLLSLFGLMRVREHERSVRALESHLVLRENAFEAIEGERDRLSDKFKQAVADLERVVSRNQELMFEKGQLAAANSSLRSEINDLRPDALAMRRKRQMDRDRRKGRG